MESLSAEAQRQAGAEPGMMAKVKAAVKLAAEQFLSPEYFTASLSAVIFLALAPCFCGNGKNGCFSRCCFISAPMVSCGWPWGMWDACPSGWHSPSIW